MKKINFLILRDRFMSLQARDRRILLLGGAFAVVLLLYVYAWMPVMQRSSATKAVLATQKKNLILMQHAVKRIDAFRRDGFFFTLNRASDLRLAVQQEVKQERLNVYQTSFTTHGKRDDQSVSLTFNSVPFDRLIHMTQSLWLHQGVYTSKLVLDNLPTSGLVRVAITYRLS